MATGASGQATTVMARVFGLLSDFPPINSVTCAGQDGTQYTATIDNMMFYIDVPSNDSYAVQVFTADSVLSYPKIYIPSGSSYQLTANNATSN